MSEGAASEDPKPIDSPSPEAASGAGAVAAPGPDLPVAWQPFTPRGVAAFSQATFNRLFLIQLVTALIAAGTVVWFLSSAWVPLIRMAIQALPETGAIENQHLQTPLTGLVPLAASRHLGLVVNVGGVEATDSGADVRVEFHERHAHVCSLLGCLTLDYPRGWVIYFNRPELQPTWDAWQPVLLGLAAIGTVGGLLIAWFILATLYFFWVWLAAYFLDRDVSLGGSWRLAAAALLPGAFLMTAAIACYGAGWVDLVRLLLAAAIHLIVPWVFMAAAVHALPWATDQTVSNPFDTPPPAPKPEPVAEESKPVEEEESNVTPTAPSNPFAPEPAVEKPEKPPKPEPPKNPFAAPPPD